MAFVIVDLLLGFLVRQKTLPDFFFKFRGNIFISETSAVSKRTSFLYKHLSSLGSTAINICLSLLF